MRAAIGKLLDRLVRDTGGALSPIFAVLLVPMVFAGGMALDYSRAVYARTALQAAADATALAVISPRYTQDQVVSVANAIFEAEIRDKYSLQLPTKMTVTLGPDGKSVTVRVDGSVTNSILQLVGLPATKIGVMSVGLRGLDNTLELALVLDNTGSMAASNKLTTLKSAANLLVDTLTQDSAAKVKIAVVPFSDYVNVGLGNRGKSWLSGSADYQTSTTTTVPATCTPASCSTKTPQIGTTNCRTVQQASTNDGVTTYTNKTVCDPVYGPPQQVCVPASCTQATTKTTVTKYVWSGCVGSRAHPNNLTDANPNLPYPAIMNRTCGSALIPLTNSVSTVKSAINAMTASGETYIPSGLVWGLNVLSPSEPFAEGAAYDPSNRKPRKAMVLMTDGMNTKSMTSTTDGRHTGSNTAQANSYTTSLCTAAKANNIELYTIALMVTDTTIKTLLQACATSGENYFDAADSAALEAAFKKIAISLQTPYLGN